MDSALVNTLAEIVAVSAPLIIAAQGELITERAGVVNLSLDGTILLSAMAAFVVAYETHSTLAGIGVAALVGMVVALFVLSASVFLSVNQVAVGFVLTLLCADLSSFLGQDYTSLPGGAIEIPYAPIPVLRDLPYLGKIFFEHNLMVYFSLLLVGGGWFWLYRTRAGLSLRALGERPTAAYSRGARVQALRFAYVALGGALVGVAGAAYSLDVQLGWRENLTLGQGWIALAIVIFGAWKPSRVLAGVYLIVGLRALALYLQRQDSLDLPVHLLNMIPWVLMLLTLLFVSSGVAAQVVGVLPPSWRTGARELLRANPPAALGQAFERE